MPHTTRITAISCTLLAACFVATEQAPPPRSAPPAGESHFQVAPPPPAVAAPAPQPVAAPPVVAAGAPAAILPPADGRYPIQLERRAVAGFVYRVRAHGAKTTKRDTRIPGRPAQSETEQLSIDLEGLVRITTVDERGDATRLDVQVGQCRTERGGVAEVLLSPGTVVTVESMPRPAKGRFVVDGREVDGQLSDYLEILFSRSHAATSDDDAFGTPLPRRPGERWQTNSALIASELAAEIPGLTPADVRGRATFHGPAEHQGLPALDVGVQLEIRARAMPNLPPGTVLDRGDMRMEMRGLFPRDPTLAPLRDRATMAVRARLRVPTAVGMATVVMQIDQEKELERSALR